MKNKLILLFLVLFFHFITNGQNNNGLAIKQFDGTPALSRADSLNGFDEIDIREHAAHAGKKGADADLFVEQAKRNYIERKYGLDRPSLDLLLRGASNSSTALNCATDNFNFEQGSAAGWTLSGNCGLMSSGTDPYGGFPNVCPLSGGGTSLKLSSDLYSGCCNSSAIKSIPVPAGGTTFFTFYFAVAIFNYPHLASAAAKFSVDFYDQSGALIPCPQFLVYHSTDNGDVGVNNFQSTPNPALYYNSAGAGDQTYNSNVTYAPWQAVTADLTPYAGTTISAVFTVKWCVPQVDWLYAIIDADCPINYIPPSSTCVTLPYNLCGPPNMQTYTWTAPGGATSNASCVNATTAGTYTVKCTPKLDCGNAVFTYTYNVQPIPTANFTPNLPTCANNLTATDNSTLHGATVASYSWDYGDGSSGTGNPTTHSYPTVPGTYNITETVTTTQGCSASVTHPVTVTNPLVLTVNSSSVCPGYSTVLTATGGASSYTWSPGTNLSGTNVATVTANPSSTTIYTVTGSNGSCTNTATSTVTVAPAVVPAPANNSPLCEGQTLNLTSGGGTSYSWNGPNSFSSTSQNPSITGVNASAAGVYTVTVTDANGCQGTGTTTVTISPSVTPAATGTTVCTGAAIDLTSSGGVTYSWSGPNNFTSSAQNPSIAGSTTAMTGVYSVTVTNGPGCVGVTTANVTVNPLPIVTVSGSTVCANATINLTSSGGTSYSWTGPSAYSSTSQNPSITNATTAMSGTYSVTVTDANGCVSGNNTNVTVNPLPIVTASGSTVCANATINLTSNGGTSYSWTGPSAYSSTSQNPSIVNATTAMSGTYSVTVTDANGCVNGNSTDVTVNPLPIVTAGGSTVCANATINLTSSGGTSYSWTGPSAYTSTLQNPSIANATTAMSGTYSVTVTDANGCVNGNSTDVTVNPNPIPTASNNSPLCVNQTLNFTGGGGTNYSWSGPNGFTSPSQNPLIANVTTAEAGTYVLVVTDANGCQAITTTTVVVNPLPIVTANGSTVCTNATIDLTSGGGTGYTWNGPGGFTSNIQNPSIPNAQPSMSGTYTVTVTDVNGCVNTNTTNVTVNLSVIVTAGSNTPCQGFPLDLTSNGGISWSWNGPGGFTSNMQNPTLASATTAMDGTYSVTATDINGCVGSATINITVNPLPNPTIGSNSPVCVNQTLNLNSGGGTGYSWAGPNGFTSAVQNPSITGVSTAASGNYTVTVTDGNGCVNTATITTVINPLPIVTVGGSTVCLNSTISLSAGGGVGYSWSGPGGFTSNSQNPIIPNATLANSGSYVATVTDTNNCVNANVAQVVVNNLPVVTATSGVICAGTITTLTASGAVNYMWTPTTGLSSSVGTSVNASPATTTAYTVTGIDANGCQSTGASTVTVNPIPPLSITPQNSSGCAPVCTSFSNTTSSSGSCSWNFGDGTTSTSCNPTHCFTGQGTFGAVLTLTDGNGCVNTATATVVVFPNPIADFYASPQPTSILDPHIQFTNASGGAVISSYTWTLNDPNHTVTSVVNPSTNYPDAGEYPVTLVVVSDHGCIDSTIKIIKIDDEFALYVPNAFSPNGDGVNDFFFAKGIGIKDFKMYIFDRWGEQVFFSDDIYKGWDGRFQSKGTEIVQEDVYVWKILVHTFKGEPKMLKGHVSLIK